MPLNLQRFAPRTILAGIFLVFLVPFLLVELFPSQLDQVMDKSSYLVFHNIAEIFSILVSLSVFSVGWFTYDQSKNRHALFLSAAFLAVGLLDLMHTLSNAAMPAFITPNSTNKSTQFWIAARLFDASAFVLSAYLYPTSRSRWLSKTVLLTTALLVTGLIFVGVVFFPDALPATALPGIGLTPLKRYLELVVILLLVAAVVAYGQRIKQSGDRSLLYYPAAFIICIFSEGAFASYKTGFDTYNVLGHLYKVVAFYLIYRGIFLAAVKAPYEKLANAERIRHLASFPQLNPHPILEISSSGALTFANPAAEGLLSSLGQGHSDFSILLPDDFAAILGELKAKKADTLQREVAIGARVFREDLYLATQFDTVRIYAYEVTERTRVEEALRESEQRVRRKLESILAPAGDLGDLELADLIDTQSMQSLMDHFYKLTHLPVGMIDVKGKVLVGVGWQDACTKFHRIHPVTCQNCIESDTVLATGVPHGEFTLYKCKNHLWDAATPIMVGDQHFGNFFMGQFFFDDELIDYELFRTQARTYGFDEQAYLAAIEKVPRLSGDALVTGMAYFMELADLVSRKSYSNLKLARSLAERDALMGSLRESEERFRNMFERHQAVMLLIEPENGTIVDANAAAAEFYGSSREELRELKIQQLNQLPPEEVAAERQRVLEEQRNHFVFPHRIATGEVRWVEVYSTPIAAQGRTLLFSIIHDVNDRKRAEDERETTVEFLRLANESRGTGDLVRAAVTFFQERSGCEAVGIRLREGNDYPYYESRGFPEDFVLAENRLCACDEAGRPICDSAGNLVLECMCGNVICERFDPAQPFFTARGSFWTNSTTELLAATSETDRQARTRNRCHGEGYESVALIPLRLGEEGLGLLQLNDRQKRRFSPETIALWERLADYLAVALAKFRADEALHESEHQNKFLANILEVTTQPFSVGYPDGRLGLFNQAYEELTGYSGEELLAIDWDETLTPVEWRERERDKLEELRRTGRPVRYEKEYLKKDGSRVPIELLIHLAADAEGNSEYYYAFFTDISERKRAEEEIRQRVEELRASNEELTRFNDASVGRELRMIELKKEINALCEKAGQTPRYPLNFVEG